MAVSHDGTVHDAVWTVGSEDFWGGEECALCDSSHLYVCADLLVLDQWMEV